MIIVSSTGEAGLEPVVYDGKPDGLYWEELLRIPVDVYKFYLLGPPAEPIPKIPTLKNLAKKRVPW